MGVRGAQFITAARGHRDTLVSTRVTALRFAAMPSIRHPTAHPAPGLLCALCLSLAAGVETALAADPLPDPLTLPAALERAADHPRLAAPRDLAERLPRRLPLYLDCHALAFGNAAPDPGRDHPATALVDPTDAQRLEILARYFDVLLADLAYARYNEAMAVAYIQFDRAATRRDLGQISDLRVLELEAVYQEVLQNRAGSEVAQRFTRSLLGQALGSPEALPRDLIAPSLPTLPNPLPSAEDTLAAALADNPSLADRDAEGAARALLELELTQQVREVLMRLAALAAAARQVDTEIAYRELKLDESRTLYEQEVTADLGYSMSQQTMTRMREARIGYCRVLAWAELNALLGRPLLDAPPDTADAPPPPDPESP